jgi:hypothetical protein
MVEGGVSRGHDHTACLRGIKRLTILAGYRLAMYGPSRSGKRGRPRLS